MHTQGINLILRPLTSQPAPSDHGSSVYARAPPPGRSLSLRQLSWLKLKEQHTKCVPLAAGTVGNQTGGKGTLNRCIILFGEPFESFLWEVTFLLLSIFWRLLKSGFCLQVLTLDNLSRKESNLQGNMKKTDLEAAQPGKMPRIML